MADPTNYEQFNANVTELVKVVQDALKAAYGLENVSHGQALGLLAGIDNLASAPVGDAAALRSAINFAAAALTEMQKFGVGDPVAVAPTADIESGDNASGLRKYSVDTTNSPTEGNTAGSYIYMPWGVDAAVMLGASFFGSRSGEAFCQIKKGGVFQGYRFFLDDHNTTVDSNGFIKQASPIFRLANDSAFAQGTRFTDAGAGAANTEAQGVTAEHVGAGVYEVSGSLGLAADGWQIELPQEPGTGQHMIMAQTSWDASTEVLTVRTFNRQFDVNTASIVPGDPVDIPDGRWLDLRLEMPEPETPEEETTP